jgi:ABC-2 type transport system permease protein
MTATTYEATTTTNTSGRLDAIPMSRIVAVELRKMFDTRSGFWLLMSIGITSLLAIVGVILFAPDEVQNYETFATAIGAPVSIILPLIATLAVTSEWSQRSGLVTFTLVPGRGRVITAKAACTVLVGVTAMLVTIVVGAAGNIVGTSISGVPTTWDITASGLFNTGLAGVLNMSIGFTLGVLIRNSAGAIVAYFVYSFLLPGVFGALAAFQAWFRDLQPWVDLNFAVTRLYDEQMTSTMWAQLGVASAIWLLLPLAVGLLLLRRSEVK